MLRAKQLNGVKFRRQEPIGNYIIDFVSFEKKLIIEIDGGQHSIEENKANDEVRTQWLESQGFRIIRFWNNEVSSNLEGVIAQIREALGDHPHPDPLPINMERELTLIDSPLSTRGRELERGGRIESPSPCTFASMYTFAKAKYLEPFEVKNRSFSSKCVHKQMYFNKK